MNDEVTGLCPRYIAVAVSLYATTSYPLPPDLKFHAMTSPIDNTTGPRI